jgi:hypothetical protein
MGEPVSQMTRAQLQEHIEKQDAEMAAMKAAALAPPPVVVAVAQPLQQVLPGQVSLSVVRVPYVGMVRATVECHIDALRKVGDVFHVTVPALWSDDPYEAVTVVRLDDNGKPVTEPNQLAPPQLSARLRKKVIHPEDDQ